MSNACPQGLFKTTDLLYMWLLSSLSWGRGSEVDLTSRLRDEQNRVQIQVGARDFLISKHIEIGSGAHRASTFMGTAFLLVVKRPERDDHSHLTPTLTELSYSPTSPLCLHGRYGTILPLLPLFRNLQMGLQSRSLGRLRSNKQE